MIKIREKLNQLYQEKLKIEEEIRLLESKLHDTKKHLSKYEKIDLFKDLFVSRTDIFAKKWISKDGKKEGFFPVTQTFKAEDYLPLTNNEIEQHLRGLCFLASYVIDNTNQCKYIVLEILQEDKFKLQIALNSLNIRAYYEVSQHNSLKAWIFFEEKVSAKIANSLAKNYYKKSSN